MEPLAYGIRLRQLRNKHHISQKKLGEMLGLQQAYISRWECGHTKLSKLKFYGIRYILTNESLPESSNKS